jgi:UDP-2,3-diacylglucosamine pyrophosphatase LpxH
LHLGSRDCQADELLGFLKHCESDYLYLVGDLVDGWSLRDEWYWPQAHNDIVQKILRKARKGTRVVYLTGNHDDFLAPYHDIKLGGITIAREALHTTASGRRLLVLHGDVFDVTTVRARWLGIAGTRLAGVRARWRQAALVLKHLFGVEKRSVDSKESPQASLLHSAAEKNARLLGADGVVCGHSHQPALRTVAGFVFANCGDWTGHCTAIAEHFDGSLELIRFGNVSILNQARAA